MPKKQPLEYQANVPAFLQRIKAGDHALDGRHNVQIPRARGGMARNGRLDMKGEEGEDDPLMLDEEGNVVSKEELEDLGHSRTFDESEDTNKLDTEKIEDADEQRQVRDDSKNVRSGFGRKRKAAKVVPDEKQDADSDEEGQPPKPVKSLSESTKDLHDLIVQNKDNTKSVGTAAVGSKKKRKKVKLSFDGPE